MVISPKKHKVTKPISVTEFDGVTSNNLLNRTFAINNKNAPKTLQYEVNPDLHQEVSNLVNYNGQAAIMLDFLKGKYGKETFYAT